MNIDPNRVATLIAEIAAAEIIPHFGSLSDDQVRTKSGPNDLVTEADEAAERALEKALMEIRPDAVFIGEERAFKDPELAEKLGSEGAFWIVDPLDGTRNFVHGKEEFGTIVAFVEGGRSRMGWIYAIPDEACAIVVEGEGATWCGSPFTSKPVPSTGVRSPKPAGLRSIGWLTEDWREKIFTNMSTNLKTQVCHCSAYAYLALMRGEVDFAIHSKIHAWDHAAGALLIAETGGKSAFLDDQTQYHPQPSVVRPLLASSSKLQWMDIRAALLD